MRKYARFRYPNEFNSLPEYDAHRGQVVSVIRELGPSESDHHADPLDCEIMYEVLAADGWRGEAFRSELRPRP